MTTTPNSAPTYRYEMRRRWLRIVSNETNCAVAFLDPATGESYEARNAKEPNKQAPLAAEQLRPLLAALPAELAEQIRLTAELVAAAAEPVAVLVEDEPPFAVG